MSIRFQCVHCNCHVKVEDRHAGKTSNCPSCQGMVTIPSHDSTAMGSTEVDLQRQAHSDQARNDQARSDQANRLNHPSPRELDEFELRETVAHSTGKLADHEPSYMPQVDPDNPPVAQSDLSDTPSESNPYQSPQSDELWNNPTDGLDAYGQPIEYAGFWLRFCAAIVDYVIMSVMQWIFLVGFTRSFSALSPEMANSMLPIAELSGVIISWFYSALMESSIHQATLGKILVGIRVTDLDGRQISFSQATGRHFGKYLSGLILCIGFLMAAFTEKKQALHDILAGTLVVRK